MLIEKKEASLLIKFFKSEENHGKDRNNLLAKGFQTKADEKKQRKRDQDLEKHKLDIMLTPLAKIWERNKISAGGSFQSYPHLSGANSQDDQLP